jgi:hypothetical protein
MKKIQPFSIWKDGKNVTAALLLAYLIQDNLVDTAEFFYSLYEMNADGSDSNQILKGNLKMTDEDYKNWEGSNADAFTWIGKQLNVTYL